MQAQPAYVAFWKAISKQAVRRGDDHPIAVGTSLAFSSYTDAERWLDAKIREYATNPEHIAEGITCKGWVMPVETPPQIIRHCDDVLVLSGERCPKCDNIVGAT